MMIQTIEEFWIPFWAVMLSIGLGGYYLVVAFVVPMGLRDIRRMFESLDQHDDIASEENENT